MASAKLTTYLWYIGVLAILPLSSSVVLACGVDGCTCDESAHLLSCIGSNLTSVPRVLTARVHTLNLSGNDIREVGDDDFIQFPELRYLDLSGNLLSNISANAFKANVHLRRLLLNDNHLSVDDVLPASVAPIRELYVSGNRIDDLDRLQVFSSLSVLDASANALVRVSETFLIRFFPRLQRLLLVGNRIEEFAVDSGGGMLLLRELNLSSNSLVRFSISGQLRNLEVLDLGWNRLSVVDADSMSGFPNLLKLVLSGNPIDVIPDFAFRYLNSLRVIEMNFLQNLTRITDNALSGLFSLRHLRLAHNSRLVSIDGATFTNITELRIVDLNSNNLSSIDMVLFDTQRQLEVLDLSGNPWPCSCDIYEQFHALGKICSNNTSCTLEVGRVCWNAANDDDDDEFVANFTSLDCRKPRVLSYTRDALYGVGSSAVLDCAISGHPTPQVVWVTNRNLVIEYSEMDAAKSVPVEGVLLAEVDSSSYLQQFEGRDRMFVLPNGSLYIAYVTRKEGGVFRCVAANAFGNATALVAFQLNYQVMSAVTVRSIIVGFLTAAGFFLLAVIIGIVRYLSFVCSRKERKKRKSIKEVLETIQDYKSAQFDKLSAYKTAKMDQLSAFKSAKIDQFSAFRHSRIDKLRTYKQATVTSVLQYLERMREHYTNQTVRIKENCAQQMDKLRESYGVRRGKFKDYRSHQVEKMRDNYNAQVLKVREYSVQQMLRLREQYKAQQQNMLKLLELLDIGNCVTVIEAECMHTESVIFDASIVFDFEAHPIHGPRDTDSDDISGESHYLTASEESGSESNIAVHSHSMSFAADVEPPGSESFQDFRPALDDFGDSDSDIFLETFRIEPMDFPELPELPRILMAGLTESFGPLERETKC